MTPEERRKFRKEYDKKPYQPPPLKRQGPIRTGGFKGNVPRPQILPIPRQPHVPKRLITA
ncbi:MAG: hypothetical protein NTX00_02150 [Candidatus Parcubacteria bacterium]|nr:hypothetical protein [Candidatus Parcubacteria bacterium]